MTRLFLDTGVLIALASHRDENRKEALALMERIAQREWRAVYTSDYVIAEALNYALAKLRRPSAAEAVLAPVFGRDGAPPVVKDVLRVHSTRFATALDRYRERFDAGLSFTDWTTLVLMEDARVPFLATYDAGFAPFAKVVG